MPTKNTAKSNHRFHQIMEEAITAPVPAPVPTTTLAGVEERSFVMVGPLREADFDSGKREATLTVIKPGWSNNGYYYGATALESIRNFINTSAKRVFVDHNPREKAFEARKVSDFIGEAQEAFIGEDGSVKARTRFFQVGPNSYVFDLMREAGSLFGPSIVGTAKVRKGTAEGRKGWLVDDVTYLHAFEVVAQPSAGGKVDSIQEGDFWFEGKQDVGGRIAVTEEDEIAEAQSLAERIKEITNRRVAMEKLSTLNWTFMDIINDLVMARDDYQFTSIAERRKLAEAAIEDFTKQLKSITFAPPRPKPEEKETANEGAEAAINVGDETIIEGESVMTLAELRVKDPAGYAVLLKEASEQHTNSEHVKMLEAHSAELEKIKPQHREAADKVAELEGKVTALETEKKDLSVKLDTATAELGKAKSKAIIEACREAVKLPSQYLTESVTKDLEAVVFEDETQFTAAITTKLNVVKELVEAASKAGEASVRNIGPVINPASSTPVSAVLEGDKSLAKNDNAALASLGVPVTAS